MPASETKSTLYIIDGHSLLHRAYHAARKRSGQGWAAAQPLLNTVSGFAAALLELIDDLDPGHMVAVTAAGRRPLPSVMNSAAPDDRAALNETASKILDVLGIHTIRLQDQDSVDIIASLTREAGITGNRACIITNNRNLCQLAGPGTRIYDFRRKKMMGPAEVAERYGVTPGMIPDVLALSGHGTQDMPGVPGIGLKTAARLINEIGGLEQILARPELVPTPRLRKSLTDNADLLRLNLRLARLDLAVPLACDMDECTMKPPHWPSVISVFRELGLTRLLKKIPHTTVETPYSVITDRDELMRFLEGAGEELILYIETAERRPDVSGILGMALAVPDGSSACYLPLAAESPASPDPAGLLSAIKPVLENPSVRKTGHHLKRVARALHAAGITLRGYYFDTMLASYLLSPFARTYSLDDVTLLHLGEKKKSWQEIFGRGQGFDEAPLETVASFMAECVWTLRRLRDTLAVLLEEKNLSSWFFGTEIPLVPIMTDMENMGIDISGSAVKEYTAGLGDEIRKVERRIFFLAGETFSLESASEVSTILFEKLRLPPVKKSGKGYATDRESLEQLSAEHEFPGELLEYRRLTEINDRYGQGLPSGMGMAGGKAFLRFDQTISGAGRNHGFIPALADIPESGVWGEKIREAFVSKEGHEFVIAAYLDMVPRLLAHFCRDVNLCALVSGPGDIHAEMAAIVLPERPLSEGRRMLKALMESFISTPGRPDGTWGGARRAQQGMQLCRKRFFDRFPGVGRFTQEFAQNVVSDGRFKTVAGRTVHIRNPRTAGYGIAQDLLSALLATSALDLIKMSMVCINNRLQSNGQACGLMLPVQKGLLLEAPSGEAEDLARTVRDEMEGVASVNVGLKAVSGIGANWEEALTACGKS